MCAQVECQPPRGMVMRVTDYSVSGDGSIRVVPTQVAGTGTLDSVELRASAGEVSHLFVLCFFIIIIITRFSCQRQGASCRQAAVEGCHNPTPCWTRQIQARLSCVFATSNFETLALWFCAPRFSMSPSEIQSEDSGLPRIALESSGYPIGSYMSRSSIVQL